MRARMRWTGLLLALLAGCTAQVIPPKVEVKPAPVVVTLGGNGGFCPPGQAKRGNC